MPEARGESMQDHKRKFTTLDAMRGIAAVFVLTRHLHNKDPEVWLPRSYMAVDLFFALSGFVLAFAYGERLRTTMKPAFFVILRLARLYPLYLLALVLALVRQAMLSVLQPGSLPDGGRLAGSVATALLFLPTPPAWSVEADPFPLFRMLFPFNAPAWSLFWEIVINAVMAVLLYRFRKIPIIAILTISASVLFAASWQYGSLNGGPNWDNYLMSVPRVFYGFFAGVAGFAVYTRLPESLSIPAILPVAGMTGLFLIPLVPGYDWLIDPVVVILLPLLVLTGAVSTPHPALAGTFVQLGAASYGIYILQVPLLRALTLVSEKLLHIPLETIGRWEVPLAILWVAGFALVFEHVYDAPVRAWLKVRLTRPSLPAAR